MLSCMKLVALHVKAMKYHKTVWRTQHAFYITEKRLKGNAERYAVYKEKDRVWKRKSRKKALSPKTATVEMEIQKRSELHVKAMKYPKTVWGT